MASPRVINSKGGCVAEALTAHSFVDFKKRCAKEGVGWIAFDEDGSCDGWIPGDADAPAMAPPL